VHLLNSQKTTFLHLFRRTVLFANSAAGISVFNIILPPRRWFFVSVCLFVCLFAVLRTKKLLNGLSQNLVERWHMPRKNHSMLVVCGGWWDPNDSTWMFISNNIATSAALAEVCVLLSVILVYYCVLYIPKFQRKSA